MTKGCIKEHTLSSEAQLKIWKYYQDQESQSFQHSHGRLSFLSSRVSPDEQVLNIGVGDGSFERFATARVRDLYSVDPIEEAIRCVQTILPAPENARVGVCQSLPFDTGFFDTVVMSEVLEHLDAATLSDGLNEVQRVLKPGGRLIGTVPANENLGEQVVICPHCGELFHRWGHVQSFTADTLRELLSNGFDDVSVQRKMFTSWSALNIAGKISAAMRQIAFTLGRSVANERFFFEAVTNSQR